MVGQGHNQVHSRCGRAEQALRWQIVPSCESNTCVNWTTWRLQSVSSLLTPSGLFLIASLSASDGNNRSTRPLSNEVVTLPNDKTLHSCTPVPWHGRRRQLVGILGYVKTQIQVTGISTLWVGCSAGSLTWHGLLEPSGMCIGDHGAPLKLPVILSFCFF